MLLVEKLLPGGRGVARVLRERATRLVLDWDRRSKSRLAATDAAGRALGIVLPRGTQLRGGDVLVAADGSMLLVEAALQPVLCVRAPAGEAGAFLLMRAAYHLGNRHVPLQLAPDTLTLEPDPVLADMLRRMGLAVENVLASFEPEGGAYAGGHGHSHGHPHDHPHGHPHGHAHGHSHAHASGHAEPEGPAHDPAPPPPIYIEP